MIINIVTMPLLHNNLLLVAHNTLLTKQKSLVTIRVLLKNCQNIHVIVVNGFECNSIISDWHHLECSQPTRLTLCHHDIINRSNSYTVLLFIGNIISVRIKNFLKEENLKVYTYIAKFSYAVFERNEWMKENVQHTS